MGLGVATRIGRFLVPIPLGTWLGLRSQPRYKAPSDLQFKIVEMQRLTSGYCPQVGCERAKQ